MELQQEKLIQSERRNAELKKELDHAHQKIKELQRLSEEQSDFHELEQEMNYEL